MIWIIALKGLAGSGKSTLGRALSKQLGWPLIDKDDIKDILDGHTVEAGGLAYEAMFNVARRQLLQGFNVICDSPLTFSISYEKAQQIASEARASLAVIECYCSDEQEWSSRINARKLLRLPAHHQTDWDKMRASIHDQETISGYPIHHPLYKVDTIRPPHIISDEVKEWIASL